MAQQPHSDQHTERLAGGRGAGRLIEKGWMVYDAVEHPLGTVNDVDTTRNILTIDGRPVGFGQFEVSMDFVGQSGGNEVHLSKVIDAGIPAAGGAPRLVDPQSTASASSSTQAHDRSAAAASTTTRPITASGASPTSSFGQFSPPYAARTPDMPPGTSAPDWGDGESTSMGTGRKIGMAALAVGGLAVAGYLMRRRMRPKTPYERFMDAISDYAGTASGFAADFPGLASDFASQRHPAWWAALAAAALPVAYYAWPSSQPTYREQARTQADTLSSWLESYAHAFADRLPSFAGSGRDFAEQMRRKMPSTPDVDMPSGWSMPFAGHRSSSWWAPSSWSRSSGWRMPSPWQRSSDRWTPSAWTGSSDRWMPSSWTRSSDWSMPGDWSAKPDLVVPLGLLAVSALALYVARRSMMKPRTEARIRDIMTRKPRVIQPNASVADAAAMMRRLDVGALPVCDGSRLIGMVTDRDITTRSTAEGRDPHLTPVRDVMSPGVAWATENDLVEEAARIMREHQIRRLPIVDDRHSLVGVVSLGDLATEVADDRVSGDTLERISE